MAREKLRYLVDYKGRKKSVLLPIKDYEELLEDLSDLALLAERKDEASVPLDVVKARLIEKWKNSGSN